MEKRRYRFLAAGIVVAVALLAVGYVRLPLAALHGLADYELLARATTLHSNAEQLLISPVQAWWLKTRMGDLSPGDSAPRISVRVKWNLLLLARADSGHFTGSTCAEQRDSLYLWFLGFWLRIHDFSHVMA
jgi:hypothetical protein